MKHELSKEELQACRAAARLINDKSITDIHWEAATAFDAGEWSGPILGEMQAELEHDVFAYVGKRFGMTECYMANCFMFWCGTEADIYQRALMAAGDNQVRIMCGDNPAKEARL